jgi:proline-rich protein PRCC
MQTMTQEAGVNLWPQGQSQIVGFSPPGAKVAAMALVDYASGSDSEGEPPLAPATAPPPPRPPPAKAKGKARIVLDLPPRTAAAPSNTGSNDGSLTPEAPARKKPRFDKPAGGGGLSALLPAPKNPTKPPLPPSSSVSSMQLPIPRSVATKFAETAAPLASSEDPAGADAEAGDDEPEVEPPSVAAPSAPAVDFFSLGGSSSGPSSISAPRSSATSLSISAAPTVADEKPPPPSLLDPYPGYWQNASGQWVARDPSADPVWAEFYATHYAKREPEVEAPKEFADAEKGELDEFDAAEAARKAYEARPEIIDPKEEARQQYEAEAAAKPQVRCLAVWRMPPLS